MLIHYLYFQLHSLWFTNNFIDGYGTSADLYFRIWKQLKFRATNECGEPRVSNLLLLRENRCHHDVDGSGIWWYLLIWKAWFSLCSIVGGRQSYTWLENLFLRVETYWVAQYVQPRTTQLCELHFFDLVFECLFTHWEMLSLFRISCQF